MSNSATAGADFGAVTGQLTWADGDDSDKVITVPVLTDSGPAERSEEFSVRLAAPGGGVGLATRTARVTILGDSHPAGLLSLTATASVTEAGSIGVFVNRQDYGAGAVSVELTIGGTAIIGEDFSLPQQTYVFSWTDGDMNAKTLWIPMINDRRKEAEETITLSLSKPTGGALIGTPSSATVRVLDDDDSGGGGGGGGHAGGLFALLSGLAGVLRLRRRASG